MNKKLVALSLGIMTAMSTAVFAAPATNLSAGKVAIDLSITKPEIEDSNLSKKTNLDFGITAGLGNNWGVQYKYQNVDSDNTAYLIGGLIGNRKFEAKSQEFNVLYQIDNNFTAFAGMNKFSGNMTYNIPGLSPMRANIDDSTKWQLGVTGTTKLGDKLSGWATLAAGSNNFTYELGLAQALSKDWDVNLFYRHKKFSDLKDDTGHTGDITVSGFGLGVTAKF